MAVNNLNTGVGIQPTIVDAKGDLIAATANDAVNRLAVGTNGQVLVADSGETTGLKWNNPGTVGGLVHINQTTFSASSAESFNNVFSATYRNYRIVINIDSASTTVNLIMRLRAGTDASGTNYARAGVAQGSAASTVFSLNAQNVTSMTLYNNQIATAPTLIILDVANPFDTKQTMVTSSISANDSAPSLFWYGQSFLHNLTNSYDGFSLIPSTGNITGQVNIYGVKQ
jgi:hypothetical protein